MKQNHCIYIIAAVRMCVPFRGAASSFPEFSGTRIPQKKKLLWHSFALNAFSNSDILSYAKPAPVVGF